MAEKILVAFSTKAGSTREIAEAIASRLGEKGLEVELQPMKKVKDLSGFNAVVLGAPMYMFHLVGDAPKFLSRFKNVLAEKPAAFFSLGWINDKEEDRKTILGNFDAEMAKFPWFKPVSTVVFGGKFDPQKLVFPYNLLPAMKDTPPADLRDWKKIEAWADEVAEKFKIL